MTIGTGTVAVSAIALAIFPGLAILAVIATVGALVTYLHNQLHRVGDLLEPGPAAPPAGEAEQ